MFGIRFIKVQPTTYLLQYKHGKVRREGVGLAFFYYGPTTSLVAIPVVSAGMRPEQLIAFAFQELAGKADKIGQLNISPDLLRELMNHPAPAARK